MSTAFKTTALSEILVFWGSLSNDLVPKPYRRIAEHHGSLLAGPSTLTISALLSRRNRQSQKGSGKGKGKRKRWQCGHTRAPPQHAVRRLDGFIARLTTTTIAEATVTTPGVAVDSNMCFCQGKRFIFHLSLFLGDTPPIRHHRHILILCHLPLLRIVRVHALSTHLHILRPRPLRPTPPIPRLPTQGRTAPITARA